MFSIKKNKPMVVLSLTITLAAGCTATGGLDIAKVFGTIMHAAALNYTGPLVTGVDALVTAFTGQAVERPEIQQVPVQGYPDQQYPAGQYPDQYPTAQYPGYQYPDSQDPGYQYPQSQYPEYQYPDTQYPDYGQQDGQYADNQQQGGQYQEYPQQGGQYQEYPQQGGQYQEYPQQGGQNQEYPQQGGQNPASQPQGGQYPEYQQQGSQYPEQSGGYQQQSWEPWGNPFPAPSRRAVPEENALSIDLALFTVIDGSPVLMPDGATLRDGVGRSTSGDRFGLVFATKEPAYVYIVNIDATGWAQTLFPYPDVPGFDNPVAPGVEVLLPNDQLYGLDDARGVETIFVLVSRSPSIELEKAIAPLRGMERSAMVGTRGATARVSVPMVGQRGLVGVIPAASQANNVSLDRFFTARSTEELAFSRWFVHE